MKGKRSNRSYLDCDRDAIHRSGLEYRPHGGSFGAMDAKTDHCAVRPLPCNLHQSCRSGDPEGDQQAERESPSADRRTESPGEGLNGIARAAKAHADRQKSRTVVTLERRRVLGLRTANNILTARVTVFGITDVHLGPPPALHPVALLPLSPDVPPDGNFNLTIAINLPLSELQTLANGELKKFELVKVGGLHELTLSDVA